MCLPSQEEEELLRTYIGQEIDITIIQESTVWHRGIPRNEVTKRMQFKILLEDVTYNMVSGLLLEPDGKKERRMTHTFLEYRTGSLGAYAQSIKEITAQDVCIYRQ